jgi:integrase
MPVTVKPLTDTGIRGAKPSAKASKLRDGGGLYLLVNTDGSRWWRFDYRRPITSTRNTLSLGTYPEVGLSAAREKRAEVRRKLAAGIDPGEQRKAVKAAGVERAANSFETIAREWLGVKAHSWTESHRSKQQSRLENHAFPWIGNRPIAELGIADIRPLLKRCVDSDHHEQAHRVMAAISNVFKFAIATERAERNPAADLGAALPARRKRHFPTLTDPVEIGALLRAIDGYQGSRVTAAALRLAPLTFVRPGELRGARWAEVDLERPDGARWTIPASRRKLRKAEKEDPSTQPHVVPLSKQAVAVLRELRPLTGRCDLVFPGVRDSKRSMSENTVNAALRNLGYTGDVIVGHGFRHMASTLLNELGFNPDAIERQLAHKAQGVRAVYNLAKHLPERRRMMQAWADHLDELRAATATHPARS